MKKFSLTEEALGRNILKPMIFLLNTIYYIYIYIYIYIYTYYIYIHFFACYLDIWLLVVILFRLLRLEKFWKLVLHRTSSRNDIASVIVMIVLLVLLYRFSFDSVVPCFICCLIYFFIFKVLPFSLLPFYSASSSTSSFFYY